MAHRFDDPGTEIVLVRQPAWIVVAPARWECSRCGTLVALGAKCLTCARRDAPRPYVPEIGRKGGVRYESILMMRPPRRSRSATVRRLIDRLLGALAD